MRVPIVQETRIRYPRYFGTVFPANGKRFNRAEPTGHSTQNKKIESLYTTIRQLLDFKTNFTGADFSSE
jgi:hypothetical protein